MNYRYLIVIILFLITQAYHSIATNPLDSNDAYADPDRDGVANVIKYTWKTDPLNPDSDNDGLPDGFEILYRGNSYFPNGLNPMDPSDAYQDLDWNTSELCYGENESLGLYVNLPYTNYDEYYRVNINGRWSPTNPLNPDTDSDGILDPDDPYPQTLIKNGYDESGNQKKKQSRNEIRYDTKIQLNRINGMDNGTWNSIEYRKGETLVLDFDVGFENDPSTSSFPESDSRIPFDWNFIWINIYFNHTVTKSTTANSILYETAGNGKLSTQIHLFEMHDIVRIEEDMKYYRISIQTTVPENIVCKESVICAFLCIECPDLIPYRNDWFISCRS